MELTPEQKVEAFDTFTEMIQRETVRAEARFSATPESSAQFDAVLSNLEHYQSINDMLNFAKSHAQK